MSFLDLNVTEEIIDKVTGTDVEWNYSYENEHEHEYMLDRNLEIMQEIEDLPDDPAIDDPAIKRIKEQLRLFLDVGSSGDRKLISDTAKELTSLCEEYIQNNPEPAEESKQKVNLVRQLYSGLHREMTYQQIGLTPTIDPSDVTPEELEEEMVQTAVRQSALEAVENGIGTLKNRLKIYRKDLKKLLEEGGDTEGLDNLYEAAEKFDRLDDHSSLSDIRGVLKGLKDAADAYNRDYKDAVEGVKKDGLEIASNIAEYAGKFGKEFDEMSGHLENDKIPLYDIQGRLDAHTLELADLSENFHKEKEVKRSEKITEAKEERDPSVHKKTNLKQLVKEENEARGLKNKPDYKSLRHPVQAEKELAASKDVLENNKPVVPKKK